MKSFVLVHGGFQGGWSYRQLSRLLRNAGHDVYTPTLTGLGERSHLTDIPINLSTHITDVANTILWEDLTEVVLLGHSYGGMVITGVADRLPDRIAALVYMDALVPHHGATLFDLRPEYLNVFLTKAAAGAGLSIAPPPATAADAGPIHRKLIDAKNVPHPFACFVEAIQLTGLHRRVTKRIYIYAEGGICEGMYDRFRKDDGAQVFAIEQSGHSIMLDQPARVAAILTKDAGLDDA